MSMSAGQCLRTTFLEGQEQATQLCGIVLKEGGRSPAWLKRRKPLCGLWKRGLALQEDCRAVVCICREKTGKVKAQFDLKLVRGVSDKKSVFKYISSKRRPKENAGQILVKVCNLTNRNEEEEKAFNAFSSSVFNKMQIGLGLGSPLG